MISYRKGDLLAEPMCRVIVHGVNCQGVMGAGVAKQIKEKFPKVYKSYKTYIKEEDAEDLKDLLGDVVIDNVSPEGSEIDNYIINAFTQELYGTTTGHRYVSYDAVDNCFKTVNLWMKANYKKGDYPTIGMPKIGAGLGGGKWEVIEQIIAYRLADFNVCVYEL